MKKNSCIRQKVTSLDFRIELNNRKDWYKSLLNNSKKVCRFGYGDDSLNIRLIKFIPGAAPTQKLRKKKNVTQFTF